GRLPSFMTLASPSAFASPTGLASSIDPASTAGSVPLQFVEAVREVAVVAGSLILLLMLVALFGFVYKSLQGDGIEWPDEQSPNEDDDAVRKGSDDDEWDYY
ncbi:MAG: hypothetical protein V5A33_07475, partial [Halobacteriales archaeon]